MEGQEDGGEKVERECVYSLTVYLTCTEDESEEDEEEDREKHDEDIAAIGQNVEQSGEVSKDQSCVLQPGSLIGLASLAMWGRVQPDIYPTEIVVGFNPEEGAEQEGVEEENVLEKAGLGTQ